MKLNLKAAGVSLGVLGALWVCWSVLIKILGIGNIPFNFVDQIYFGILSPTYLGAFIGLVLGFIDGFIGGILLAFIYNKVTK